MRRALPILVVEDSKARVDRLTAWLPKDRFRLVWGASPGAALGNIKRSGGADYAGIMLDHDLDQRAITPSDLSLSGRDLVHAILDSISPDVPILIHSNNVVHPPTMEARLVAGGFSVDRVPFRELTRERLLEWLTYVEETSR